MEKETSHSIRNEHEAEIKQNNQTILYGDRISVGIIFNNLTAQNFQGGEYRKYKEFAQSEGFDLAQPLELWEGNTLLKTGNFR